MFTYQSIKNGPPGVGDEGEIYTEGQIVWVTVTHVTEHSIHLSSDDGATYHMDHETFYWAVGDV